MTHPGAHRESTAGLVLAAGNATRFGGIKLLAPLDGRPILEHVLDAAAAASLDPVVVVLGRAAADIERRVAWRTERRVTNPDPDAGLSTSLRIGIASLADDPAVRAVVVLLGDQPRVRPEVIRRLIAAGGSGCPIAVARYGSDSGPNPVLLAREAWPLVEAASGDRGMGPLIAARPDLVAEVDVGGDNPDVDTPADLEALGRSR